MSNQNQVYIYLTKDFENDKKYITVSFLPLKSIHSVAISKIRYMQYAIKSEKSDTELLVAVPPMTKKALGIKIAELANSVGAENNKSILNFTPQLVELVDKDGNLHNFISIKEAAKFINTPYRAVLNATKKGEPINGCIIRGYEKKKDITKQLPNFELYKIVEESMTIQYIGKGTLAELSKYIDNSKSARVCIKLLISKYNSKCFYFKNTFIFKKI